MKPYYLKTWAILTCFALLTCIFSCSKDNSPEDIEKQEALSISNGILQLVNKHRKGIGKNTLSANDLATQLAEEHTLFMIDQNEMSHENFDQRGRRLIDEEKAVKVGENVAYKYKTAQEVMEAWLNSAAHRKNIEADFTDIGIGAIKNDVGLYYFTQLFFKK
tara:strand:+ start:168 stop:653 length:486 start_codon:yes stop_codon:yes gene_type:complete